MPVGDRTADTYIATSEDYFIENGSSGKWKTVDAAFTPRSPHVSLFFQRHIPSHTQHLGNADSECFIPFIQFTKCLWLRSGRCSGLRNELYLCWFSLSSCCGCCCCCCWSLVWRNLLLASSASMSSISLLLSSRRAERIRRLSSRSTVPSSCMVNICKKVLFLFFEKFEEKTGRKQNKKQQDNYYLYTYIYNWTEICNRS